MTAIHHGGQLQKPGSSLDGVEATENGVQQILVFRLLFQLHKLFRELLENLPGLNQKILKNLFVIKKTHVAVPLRFTFISLALLRESKPKA